MKVDIKKINYVVALHGDEVLPLQALKDNNISHIIGNPKAVKAKKRFIENDLNAAFNRIDGTYESRRAQEILAAIPDDEYVVDFHTTTATTPPFVIVVDKKMTHLASTTGVKKVVLMTYNIKNDGALINKRDGISIELGKHDDQKASYELPKKIIKNIQTQKEHTIKLYEVYDKITEPGNYTNFKKHPEGFYPVLSGGKAYEKEGFYGMKARLIQ